MIDEEEAELRNPFPAPPSHYNNYTSRNLELLALLRERTTEGDLSQINQQEVLRSEIDVPEWPLIQLEKPRADWIYEDGYYTVFGDTWFVKEVVPTLGEQGGQQLYPADPSVDRRPALLAVLKSILVAYSNLVNALLAPPPSATSEIPPDWQRYVEWITVLTQNLMAAVNDLRPVQARGNIELMMKRQLELRKQETKALHEKCDTLQARLEELRSLTQKPASTTEEEPPPNFSPTKNLMGELLGSYDDDSFDAIPPQTETTKTLTNEDVLRWAEEIG